MDTAVTDHHSSKTEATSINCAKQLKYSLNKRSDYFTRKNYFTERKRALRCIHPRTFDLGITVRVGAKLRC